MSLMMISSSRKPYKDEISLPEDIWIDIFFRIPIQHVFEFRRISKYFRELIDSDEFIRRHYDVSIKTRPTLVLHQMISDFGRKRTSEPSVIHLDLEISDHYKVNEFKPPFKDDEPNFLGCRKGILCYKVQKSLIFWNPLTGVSRRSTSHIPEVAAADLYRRYFFGHDTLTDDLKVFKITRLPANEEYNCVIYSSKTDSWIESQGFYDIRNDGKLLRLGHYGDGVFVEPTNCMHMIAAEHESPHARNILAFDFRSEKFNLVPLPQIGTNWDLRAGLSSVDDCLCAYICGIRDYFLKAWIMKRYGDEQSWAPLLCIPKDVSFWHGFYPIGFAVKKGRRPQLMLVRSLSGGHTEELYLYDAGHQEQLNNTQRRCLMGSEVQQHYVFAPRHRKP